MLHAKKPEQSLIRRILGFPLPQKFVVSQTHLKLTGEEPDYFNMTVHCFTQSSQSKKINMIVALLFAVRKCELAEKPV